MGVIKHEDDLSGYGIAADDKQSTIVSFTDFDAEDIIIPSHFKGSPIRKIGFAAFKGMERLRTVIMPDTIKHIENSAFRSCPNLEKVVISQNLENIAPYSFANCKNLKSVTLPSKVRALPNHVFDKCYNLTEFIVWDSNKMDGSSKRFVVASKNEHRRFGFMQSSILYFDNYNMTKYDEGYAVIQEFDDLFNIAEYRLFFPEQLSEYHRKVYENAIRMFIPKLIREDQVTRLASAGELGIITEARIDDYLEMASAVKGSCMAYLLELKEKKFAKHTLEFEL